MKKLRQSIARASIVVLTCAHASLSQSPPPTDSLAPRGDHHTHLGTPDAAAYVAQFGDPKPTLSVNDLIAALDSAHVTKAVVLSTAYFFGAPDAVRDSTRDE